MYLRRKIDGFLKSWKQTPGHKPLIVKGARQIGKTESILHFAKKEYKNVVNINFALESRYKTITSDGYEVGQVLRNITLIDPSKQFIAGETLVLFDEIQEYPDIATTLKAFRLDGRFDVICSGSLLGINYRKIHSNSVGNKQDYEMFSMDFEEFLWAKGYPDTTVTEMLSHMSEHRPFSDTEFSVFRGLFLDYCVLGGMPEVVRQFIETGLFSGSKEMQKQIRLDYEEDIRKYAEGLDQAKIVRVYRSIPVQLAKDNKKFQYSKVSPSARAREYSGCIEWLRDAGVVLQCYCLGFPELPLKGNYDESRFKLYYPDTGLLVSTLDEEAQEDLRVNKNLGVYKGALYENMVAEALYKQNLGLFYYVNDSSTVEADFFVRTQNALIPVEVKAGQNKSASLRTLIQSDHYKDITFGIKFGDCNVGCSDGIDSFPWFCAFLLKRYLSTVNSDV